MQTLTRASQELFRRTPDERFASLSELSQYCHGLQEHSADRWVPPMALSLQSDGGRLRLATEEGDRFDLND